MGLRCAHLPRDLLRAARGLANASRRDDDSDDDDVDDGRYTVRGWQGGPLYDQFDTPLRRTSGGRLTVRSRNCASDPATSLLNDNDDDDDDDDDNDDNDDVGDDGRAYLEDVRVVLKVGLRVDRDRP